MSRRGPKIVVFSMTRDEGDILEDWIAHHLSYGVDHLVVCDHGSVDGTREVLGRFGDGITVVAAPPWDHPRYAMKGLGHYRDLVMTEAWRGFQERHGTPEWLSFLDTDELVWDPRGDLAVILRDVPSGCAAACFDQKLFAVTECDAAEDPRAPTRQTWRIPSRSPLFYSYHKGKSFYRGEGFRDFHGSHRHPGIASYWNAPGPAIHHYCIRGEDQFVRKVANLTRWTWLNRAMRLRIRFPWLAPFLRVGPGIKHKLRWYRILAKKGTEGLRRYYRRRILLSRADVERHERSGALVRDGAFAEWVKGGRGAPP